MSDATVLHLEQIDSTNDFLKSRIKSGDFTVKSVTADFQTSGRGRGNNSWVSLKGNLHLSVAIQINEKDPLLVGPWCSFCACEFLKNDFNVKACVKWPNDLLVEDKKIAGFLLEMVAGPGNKNYVIVGIGLNISKLPETDDSFHFPPACLSDFSNSEFSVETIGKKLSSMFLEFENTVPDRKKLLYFLNKNSSTIGKTVQVNLPGGNILRGIASEITDDFALMLKTETSLIKITGGDLLHIME